MPELPEVQTIVDDLNKKIINKKIVQVDLRLKKIVKGDVRDFLYVLTGNSFIKIKRRGKLIIFQLRKNNQFLLIHLRMTGQLIYQKKNQIIAGGHSEVKNNFSLPNKHSHLIIFFQDKGRLFFNDQRQFGTLQIVNREELEEKFKRIGVEPLSEEFDFNYFKNLIKNKKTNIKAFLLNQKYISGIGNIYADEILFSSQIKPDRKINSLNLEEKKVLFKNIKKILKQAIKHRGTTFNDYRDADGNKGNFIKKLKVYKREGLKCKNCLSIIKKIKVAGRGTRYCPKCQK